jgi:hypothetical protein
LARNTPSEAASEFVHAMRQALACLGPPAALIRDFADTATREYELALAGNRPLRVSTPRGDVRYLFAVRQRFVVREAADPPAADAWQVVLSQYQYSLADDEGREIVAYHWHPPLGIDGPHLHLSAAAGSLRPELQTAHLPTGYVPFADIVLMLIRDFNVKARQDYRSVLERLRTTT